MKTSILGATLVLSGLALLGGSAVRAQDEAAADAPAAPAPAAAPTPAQRKITVDFRDMALRDAVDSLFRGTNINYTVTPAAIQAVPTVSMSLRDVPFETALGTLTRTYGLRYTRDRDGIYTIDVRQVEQPGVTTPVGPTVPEVGVAPDVAPTLQIEKIPMNYVDSVDIYGALSGQGSNRAAGSMGGGMGGFGGGNMGGGFGGGGFGGNSFGGGGFGGGGFGGNSFGGGGFGGNSFGGGGFGGNSFGGGGFGGGGFGGGFGR